MCLKRYIISLLVLSCYSISTWAATPSGTKTGPASPTEPPAFGNFILPGSQQPGAFISLGQSVIDKGVTQLFLGGNYLNVNQGHYTNLAPALFYGITNRLTFGLTVPYAVSYQDHGTHANGLNDTAMQLEYAFYSKSSFTHVDQATIIGAITLPTGGANNNPTTGYGSPTYLLGGTFSRIYIKSIIFASGGAQVTSSHGDSRVGNSYLYQAGLGNTMMTLRKDWIIAWLVEADGTFTNRSKQNGAKDPNSGGNIVYVTPSISVSSKHTFVQVGVGLPVSQNLYGNQHENYFIAGLFGWTLY